MDSMESIIADFCSDRKRQELFDFVNDRTKLTFDRSKGSGWGGATKDGITTIYCAPTKYPLACLAHELLHAKLKASGYKQYVVSICDGPKRRYMKELLQILDNELQHHKFFNEFVALGFDPSQMYEDADSETGPEMRSRIAKLRKDVSLEELLVSYVTVIAPGGAQDQSERLELQSFLEDKCANRFWKRLCTIGATIRQFAEGSDLDAGPAIVRILRSLGGYEVCWIGWKDDFPAAGLFVDKKFEWIRPPEAVGQNI